MFADKKKERENRSKIISSPCAREEEKRKADSGKKEGFNPGSSFVLDWGSLTSKNFSRLVRSQFRKENRTRRRSEARKKKHANKRENGTIAGRRDIAGSTPGPERNDPGKPNKICMRNSRKKKKRERENIDTHTRPLVVCCLPNGYSSLPVCMLWWLRTMISRMDCLKRPLKIFPDKNCKLNTNSPFPSARLLADRIKRIREMVFFSFLFFSFCSTDWFMEQCSQHFLFQRAERLRSLSENRSSSNIHAYNIVPISKCWFNQRFSDDTTGVIPHVRPLTLSSCNLCPRYIIIVLYRYFTMDGDKTLSFQVGELPDSAE